MTLRRRMREKVRAKMMPFLRLFVFALSVACVATWFLFRQAKVSADAVALATGAEMMHYANAREQDGERAVFMNGQRFGFGSGTTDDSVTEVLDFFAARCQERGLNPMRSLLDAAETRNIAGTAAEWTSMTQLSERVMTSLGRGMDRRGRGYQACFDVGGRPLTMTELMARGERFARTKRLSEFGNMRYVFAEPIAGRGTHFLVVYTDAGMALDEMFPRNGDAPGVDAPDVDRYPGTRRILSAWEDGMGPSLNVYTVASGTLSDVRAHYLRSVEAHGWELPNDPRVRNGPGFSVDNGPRNLTVHFAEDAERHQVSVTVLSTR